MPVSLRVLTVVLFLGFSVRDGLANERVAQIDSVADSPAYKLERQEIAQRLLRPWDIVFISSTEAIVTEKEGGLRRVDLVTGAHQPIEGLPNDLDNINKTGLGDNSGLFGVVLAPDFNESRWLYLSYAAKASKGTTTKVIRAKLNADKLSDIESILVATPFSDDRYHYGGGLVFGSDGMLYVTVGERLFSEADEPALPIAQDLKDKRGKIYRLKPDGSIPNDNPHFADAKFGDNSEPGIYALGIRAAQGMTLHPKTGAIWFSEHGTRQGDELNILNPGANYGWPIKTAGDYRDQAYRPPPLGHRQFTPPVWSWADTVAPTGLTFYFGSEFSDWNGDLLLAGLSKGSFWRMRIDTDQVVEAKELFADDRIRLRNVKQAPDGKLYLLTDEANGRILRVVHRLAVTPSGQTETSESGLNSNNNNNTGTDGN